MCYDTKFWKRKINFLIKPLIFFCLRRFIMFYNAWFVAKLNLQMLNEPNLKNKWPIENRREFWIIFLATFTYYRMYWTVFSSFPFTECNERDKLISLVGKLTKIISKNTVLIKAVCVTMNFSLLPWLLLCTIDLKS